MTTNWNGQHRPWPVPTMPWTMEQTWSELLFLHYRVSYEELRKHVPANLPIDTYNGDCYIGIVPFQMSGVRQRGLPLIPGTDQFPELNVRTYVTLDGKPGVYFFSLEASSLLAVEAAKALFHLPYWHAQMVLEKTSSEIKFYSQRKKNAEAILACKYRPISEPMIPHAGSFESWMVERYCFYTIGRKGEPLRCDIDHAPWQVQQAEVQISENTILSSQGIHVEKQQPTVHFAREIHIHAWPLVHFETNQIAY